MPYVSYLQNSLLIVNQTGLQWERNWANACKSFSRLSVQSSCWNNTGLQHFVIPILQVSCIFENSYQIIAQILLVNVKIVASHMIKKVFVIIFLFFKIFLELFCNYCHCFLFLKNFSVFNVNTNLSIKVMLANDYFKSWVFRCSCIARSFQQHWE